MRGRTVDEINAKRQEMKDYAILNQNAFKQYEEIKIEFIDSLYAYEIEEEFNEFTNIKIKDKAKIRGIGKAIVELAKADIVIFEEQDVWEHSFGCYIEKLICNKYNIQNVIHLEYKG